MCSTAGPCQVGWAETLPTGCPPSSSVNPGGEIFFRLVGTPPTADDFRSQAARFPGRFKTSGCVARAVSMWSSIEKVRKLRLLPGHAAESIAMVAVPLGSGVVRGKPNGHCSWWLCSGFNPLPETLVVE
jgi:hypothetical protein